MRLTLGLLVFVFASLSVNAAPPERYGVAADLKSFPQATPKEALASVLKAIEEKKFDYLGAQLAEPAFIDDQVKRLYGGRFAEQVESLQSRLDRATTKMLQLYASEGEWTIDKDNATASLKGTKSPVVKLKKIEDRWYLLHSSKP